MKEVANYCLGCINKPCSKGCPLNNNIPGFIQLIKEDKLKEAYELLSETTVLQSICGRICPHTKQCEGKCIRGYKGEPVNIGKLESYIGDEAIKNNWDIPIPIAERHEKIAVIGSGPAGLTCAAFLKRAGFHVTIYEKHNYLGGLLRHGIPEFRLPKKILDETINKIISI
jgi:glutamate synthase (NADPH/NADH) small chain